jgi:signal transduction histidine kinase/ligand-binding sensor domain-containing protein
MKACRQYSFAWSLPPRGKVRAIGVAIMLLLGMSHFPAYAATQNPTLIRLSLWGPPESHDSIATVYETTLEPILVRHDFEPSMRLSRPTVDSVYARLLEIPSPAAFAALKSSVQRDSLWRSALRLDADTTGAAAVRTAKHRFDFYRSPAGPGRSVKARPGVRSGDWEILDSSAGLPHDVAYQVQFDPDGVAWVATFSRGLVRYDGLTITHYTQADGLPGNGAGEVAVTSSGSLWIKVQGGKNFLVHFDGETFETYDEADGLPFHYSDPFTEIDYVTRVHVADSGDLWLGTHASDLLRLRRDPAGTIDLMRFGTVSGEALGEVFNIQDDGAGRLWVTARRTDAKPTLYELDGETLRVVEDFEDTNPATLGRGPGGEIWIGAKSTLFKHEDGQWIRRDFPDDPGGIWDFHVQDDGTIWTVSPAGLQQRKGDSVTDHENTLLSTWGLVTQSPDGTIWMGTWGAGLARSSINSIQSWDSPYEQVWTAMERSDGELWIATQQGTFRFEDGDLTEAFRGTREGWVFDLTEDHDGNVWMAQPWRDSGRQSGVFRTDADSAVTVTDEDGLPFEIRDVFVAGNGDLWLVGVGGISRHNGERFQRFGKQDGFPLNDAKAVCQAPSGDLWFAHGGGAVTRLAAGKQPRPETLTVFLGPPGVRWSSNDIYCSKSGHVWAAGRGGISRFDPQTQRWTYHTDHPAWAVGLVNALAEDEAGHLLLALDRGGIARYDGKVFQFLDRRDGVARGSAYDVVPTRDGSIWITTSTGITRYQPSPGKPHLSMQGLLADRDYSADEEISFASGQPRVEISYQGRDLKTRPEAMVYRFRLVGVDSTWATTNDTKVIYEDLASGDYTFEVEVVDRDLGYSDLATLSFRVTPPYGLAALVAGLVLALGLAGWQTIRVVRRDHRLTTQNRDLLIEAALERIRARALAMESTDQIGEISTHLFEEFQGLGFSQRFLSIVLIDDEAKTTRSWAHVGWGESPITTTATDEIREDLWDGEELRWQRQKTTIKAWRQGQAWDSYTMSVNDLRGFFRTAWSDIDDDEFERRIAAFGGTIYGHSVFHRHGQLSVSGREPLTDEGLRAAKRFADLFAFAYDRHLELAQKEERSHQLAVEIAAARVRAEAMAMESTQDMRRVAGLVSHELKELGVPTQGCMVYLLDEEQQTVHWYLAYNDLDALDIAYDPARVLKLQTGTYIGYQQTSIDPQTHGGTVVGGDGHETRLMDDLRSRGSQVQALSDDQVKWTREHPVLHMLGIDATDENLRLLREEPGMVRVTAYWGRGMIATRSSDMTIEDAPRIETILTEFSNALSLGFQRFLDFQQLEQASVNKSQFLRRMSHDLRSPMNAIIGYSRLLRRRLADRMDEREARNLGNIETSSGNLLNLINDILDLSRIEAGRIEVNRQPVDLRQLANECADALESIVHESVVLRRDLADVGLINSDPDRLRQIVMNLLGNATKFTESGSITLSLKHISGRASSTDSSSAGPVDGEDAASSDTQIELSVADTGIGIPADDLPHIFDEFRQVERQGGEGAEGTGLGLAIAKKTVDLLGGEITATSEVGVGTTFSVRIPAASDAS